MSLRQIRRSTAQDLVLLLEQLDPFVAPRRASDSFPARPDERVADLRSSIVSQRFRHEAEIPKYFAT
jgi:hypothetical protein